MVRVHVLVEGQTEETFVHRVLRSHFWPLGIYPCPRQLGKPGHRTGIVDYPRARGDILTTMREDAESFCTTMFDYYGMPSSWPGREAARQKPFVQKPVTIEQAILADISTELGGEPDFRRFIPYVQMHEFEALLFSDPKHLADGLGLKDDSEVQRIRREFPSPEEINDSSQTAPSKRIKRLSASYDKVADGYLISQSIGLPVIRDQCPHFDEWIRRLEALTSG